MNNGQRTKNAIIDGFLSMIDSSHHEDMISIKEILSTCMVAKATFYKYFKNKDDLVNSCYKDFSDDLFQHAKQFFLQQESEKDFILYINLNKNRIKRVRYINKDNLLNRFYLEYYFLMNNENASIYFGHEVFDLLYEVFLDEQPCSSAKLQEQMDKIKNRLELQEKTIGGITKR